MDRLNHQVDNMLAMHSMVRAGLGVALLPCYTVDRDPTLVRLNLEPLIDSKFDMWILYHPDSRRAQRLQLFAEFVIDHMKEDVDLIEGRRPYSESACTSHAHFIGR
jgi:DNA-binding transcriptional LysR family regulator